jgi:hypothetical protein
MSKLNPFNNTMKELNLYTDMLEAIGDYAIELGVDEKHLTMINAFQKCNKALREHIELTKKATELGYTSLPTALKALSQMKERAAEGVSNLPEELQTIPNIWLTGRPKSKNNAGFVGLSLWIALKTHRRMLPIIVEAWELICKKQPEDKEELLWMYQRVSADEFGKECFRYIHNLEEVPLEEEFEARIADTEEDIQRTYDYIFDPNRIYDVTNEPMPEVEWSKD